MHPPLPDVMPRCAAATRPAVLAPLLIGLLAVAACSPTQPPPNAVTVPVTLRAGVAAPPAQGETQLVVRAVPSGATRQELPGVTCRAETPYFTADFTAPARLLLPDYGSAAPPVTVTCRNGTATGTATAMPEAAWTGGLGGWPAIGVSVGTGNAAGVGVGVGWAGGGAGTSSGVPVTRYNELRVPIPPA